MRACATNASEPNVSENSSVNEGAAKLTQTSKSKVGFGEARSACLPRGQVHEGRRQGGGGRQEAGAPKLRAARGQDLVARLPSPTPCNLTERTWRAFT